MREPRVSGANSPPLRGGGGVGGGVEENKKQSIVLAGLFSYWGGSAVVCLGIGRAAHVGMGSTIVYPLSLSLSLGHMSWSRAHSGNDVGGGVFLLLMSPPPPPQPRII